MLEEDPHENHMHVLVPSSCNCNWVTVRGELQHLTIVPSMCIIMYYHRSSLWDVMDIFSRCLWTKLVEFVCLMWPGGRSKGHYSPKFQKPDCGSWKFAQHPMEHTNVLNRPLFPLNAGPSTAILQWQLVKHKKFSRMTFLVIRNSCYPVQIPWTFCTWDRIVTPC